MKCFEKCDFPKKNVIKTEAKIMKNQFIATFFITNHIFLCQSQICNVFIFHLIHKLPMWVKNNEVSKILLPNASRFSLSKATLAPPYEQTMQHRAMYKDSRDS